MRSFDESIPTFQTSRRRLSVALELPRKRTRGYNASEKKNIPIDGRSDERVQGALWRVLEQYPVLVNFYYYGGDIRSRKNSTNVASIIRRRSGSLILRRTDVSSHSQGKIY